MRNARSPEVIVIGAGVAGLSAARAVADQGIAVELVEATERVGGRVRTIVHGHGALPVELGAEFVHGRPDATLQLVREAGLSLDQTRERHHVWRDGRLVDAGDLWERFGKLLAPACHATADESAHDYLDRVHMAPDDAGLFAHFVEGFYGASLDDISIQSIAADASGAGSGEAAAQTRVRGGYGQLVDFLATRLARAGVPIHLGCRVDAIDWRTMPVRVEIVRNTARETLLADRVVVALPAGVLQQSIRFQPALGSHAAALAGLAMGQVVKVVICLREPVWEPRPRELAFVHGRDLGFPTFWLRTQGNAQQLTAWAGGPHARVLANAAGDWLVERALDGFAASTGVDRGHLAGVVRDTHFHDFQADPYARGAYSYARVGASDAADTLARPLGDRLFFAGEATDVAYEGTVAGALASGKRAAQAILRRVAGHHRRAG